MKKDIHPTYNKETRVTCACGNNFLVGSTMDEIKVEICSNCHPFFTGNEKIIDTAGRVERFKTRQSKVDLEKVKAKSVKKTTKRAKVGKKVEVKKSKKADKN